MNEVLFAPAAERVATRLGLPANGGPQKFDPATILLLIQVVIAVVKLVKACRANAADASRSARAPGVWTRYRVRRAVRAELTRAGSPLDATAVAAAVLAVAADLPPTELAPLLEAIPA